jgi:uncharacterized protein YqgV (UPF0045/DUF77 family)
MIVAVSLAPAGQPIDGYAPDTEEDGAGVADAVALAVTELRASGLPVQTNAMFTNIEGEWDEVMAAVRAAVDVLARRYPRVSLVLKADIRAGHDGELQGKLDRLERALDRQERVDG